VSEPPPTARNAAAAANHSAGCRRRRWSRSELPAEQRPPQQRALGAPHTQRPAVLAAGWPAVLAAGWPVSAGRKAIETRSGGSGAAAAARRAQCTRFISVDTIVVFRFGFYLSIIGASLYNRLVGHACSMRSIGDRCRYRACAWRHEVTPEGLHGDVFVTGP
jgi:hypothetical protein